MQSIYLDHAATTPMKPEVIQEMLRVMENVYGNPSSIHQFGRQAKFELEMAREVIAKSIHALPNEIVFNSGGTEGDNTAIIQTALNCMDKGKHIISTNVEHSAVLNSLHYLEKEGFEVTYLPINAKGQVTVEQVEAALREDTILVSIMFGNNEIGAINPIQEIGELLKEHQALFHSDAVQAFGSELIDVQVLGVDFLSVSSHKINGPKGVGFIYERRNVATPILIHGGDQEEKKRAGTENVPGIVGMAKAISLLTPTLKAENQNKYLLFKKIIVDELTNQKVDFEINGQIDMGLAHILNLWIKDTPNNLLLSNLDLKGFGISTGSACNAGTVKPSQVIYALKPKTPKAAEESIRISFGYGLTAEDIEVFVFHLIKIIQTMKQG